MIRKLINLLFGRNSEPVDETKIFLDKVFSKGWHRNYKINNKSQGFDSHNNLIKTIKSSYYDLKNKRIDWFGTEVSLQNDQSVSKLIRMERAERKAIAKIHEEFGYCSFTKRFKDDQKIN